MQLVEEKSEALELYPDRIVEKKCNGSRDEEKSPTEKRNKRKKNKITSQRNVSQPCSFGGSRPSPSGEGLPGGHN
jgi:hypothetical protein